MVAGPHGHPNAAAALGTPPSRRELSLTPRRGFTRPRLRCATPARLPRWGPRCGRRRYIFFTGGGAPPPPRPVADTSPRIPGPRRGVAAGATSSLLAAGAPPPPAPSPRPRLRIPGLCQVVA